MDLTPAPTLLASLELSLVVLLCLEPRRLLLRRLVDVGGGDEVALEIASTDHLAHEEPTEDLYAHAGVDEKLLKVGASER